jgi:biopolymer transport protein ExbB/TolQ
MNPSVLPPSHSLSFVKLFEDADPIVQAVMIGLALASVVCWGIGFKKLIRYVLFSRQLRVLERFVESRPGEQVARSELARRFEELASSEPRSAAHGLSEFQANLERSFQNECATLMRNRQSGLSLLATVGSTAPFIGLFGTIWAL